MKIFCFKAPRFISFFLKPFAKKNNAEDKVNTKVAENTKIEKE